MRGRFRSARSTPWRGPSNLRWETCVDFTEFEVLSCVWVSPLECFEHTGVWEACLQADDPTAPQDLLPYAARQAFLGHRQGGPD